MPQDHMAKIANNEGIAIHNALALSIKPRVVYLKYLYPTLGLDRNLRALR